MELKWTKDSPFSIFSRITALSHSAARLFRHPFRTNLLSLSCKAYHTNVSALRSGLCSSACLQSLKGSFILMFSSCNTVKQCEGCCTNIHQGFFFQSTFAPEAFWLDPSVHFLNPIWVPRLLKPSQLLVRLTCTRRTCKLPDWIHWGYLFYSCWFPPE